MKAIKISNLLNKKEELLFLNHFTTNEPTLDTLATGIVQIFKSHQQWTLLHMGILYLLFDETINCYYLKLYSTLDATLLFHQELYQKFIYVTATNYFHMFEGDDAIYGINFSEILEADEFQRYINTIKTKHTNKLYINLFNGIKRMKRASWLSGWSRNKRRIKIGRPSEFKHVTHVGFDCIFGEEGNQHIVNEIKRILKLDMNLTTDEMETEEIHDYINWVALELRYSKRSTMAAGTDKKLTSEATTDHAQSPPAITWSTNEDYTSISMIKPIIIEPQPQLESSNPTNSKSQPPALMNYEQNRKLLANAIAAAIVKRSVQNYSDFEEDQEELNSDDEWH